MWQIQSWTHLHMNSRLSSMCFGSSCNGGLNQGFMWQQYTLHEITATIKMWSVQTWHMYWITFLDNTFVRSVPFFAAWGGAAANSRWSAMTTRQHPPCCTEICFSIILLKPDWSGPSQARGQQRDSNRSEISFLFDFTPMSCIWYAAVQRVQLKEVAKCTARSVFPTLFFAKAKHSCVYICVFKSKPPFDKIYEC